MRSEGKVRKSAAEKRNYRAAEEWQKRKKEMPRPKQVWVQASLSWTRPGVVKGVDV